MILEFLKSTKNLSQKTLSAYMTDINMFMRFEKNVLEPNIRAYVSFLQSSGLKDSSVKRKIVSLRVFYDYLFSEKIIDNSPFFIPLSRRKTTSENLIDKRNKTPLGLFRGRKYGQDAVCFQAVHQRLRPDGSVGIHGHTGSGSRRHQIRRRDLVRTRRPDPRQRQKTKNYLYFFPYHLAQTYASDEKSKSFIPHHIFIHQPLRQAADFAQYRKNLRKVCKDGADKSEFHAALSQAHFCHEPACQRRGPALRTGDLRSFQRCHHPDLYRGQLPPKTSGSEQV